MFYLALKSGTPEFAGVPLSPTSSHNITQYIINTNKMQAILNNLRNYSPSIFEVYFT